MQGKYIHILLSNNTGERLESEDAPIGWDATKINLVRDILYIGVLKTISVEFNFVGEFYTFLQRHRLRYGWDMDVVYRCYLRKGMVFQFEGKINSTPSGSENRKLRRWKCDIVQSTAVLKFQNREDTEVNVLNSTSLDQLPIAPALRKSALIRGKLIQFYSKFTGLLFENPIYYNHIVPFWMQENGNPGVEQVYDEVGGYDILGGPLPSDLLSVADNWFYTNVYPSNQTLKIKLEVEFALQFEGSETFLTNNFNPRFRLMKVHLDEDDELVMEELRVYNFWFPNGSTVGGSHAFTLDDTFVVEPGYGLVWMQERGAGGVPAFPFYAYYTQEGLDDFSKVAMTYTKLEMKLWQDSVVEDSTHPVILPLELFENLIAQINGLPVQSPVFGRTDRGYDEDGEFAYLGVTTGLWLRGIDVAEEDIEDDDDTNNQPRLNTSFKAAFTSYNWPVPLGVQITPTHVVIDKLSNMLSREVNADLGEVDDFEIVPLTEFMFNEVLVGYPLNEYEEQNGRDEPNTFATYTNSLQCYKKKYDLRSVYCGDSYGIEFARRAGIINTGSSDTKYDEKIFFVDLIKDEEGQLISRRLEGILLCEGVFSPETMMNVRIANSQNLLRHKEMLNVPLDKKPLKQLFFQSKPKNANMRVVTALGDTTEGQNINLGNQAHFLPNAGVFSLSIKITALSGIMANPLGLSRYTHKGETFYDFILNVNAEQEKNTSKWRTIQTQSSPPDIAPGENYGNIIKYGDGLEDFVKYGDGSNDFIKYAD